MNVYKIFSDIGLIIFISVISLIVLSNYQNPVESIDKIMNYFVESLIPMILGDVAGTIVAEFLESVGIE